MEDTTSSAGFMLTYSGEAVEQGEMDVRLLAPALLSLGQLFDRANEISNAKESVVNLRVRATSRGSFGVELDIVQSVVFTSTAVLSGQFITAAINLKELVVGGSRFLDLIRRCTSSKQVGQKGSL